LEEGVVEEAAGLVGVTDGAPTVRAAGGAVWRRAAAGVEVLLVHRPKYDDWTLPKGKAELDESEEHTALREVEEETGLVCVLGAELVVTKYVDHLGRPKTVRYWAMTVEDPDAQPPFEPNHEVDELAWMDPDTARGAVTYERDLAVIDALVAAVVAGKASA
jgi:8-oxo-dGTP diphosphatase